MPVQQDLSGAYVTRDKEEREHLIFTAGGFRAKIPLNAAHIVQAKRLEMEKARQPGGKGRRFKPDDIVEWVIAWVHNRVKALPLKKHHATDSERLVRSLMAFVAGGEEGLSTVTPERVTTVYLLWNTQKFMVRTKEPTWEKKSKRWTERVTAAKGDRKGDAKRAVEGERMAWLQSGMRLVRGEVLRNSEFEDHARRLYEGIFEGKGVRVAGEDRRRKGPGPAPKGKQVPLEA